MRQKHNNPPAEYNIISLEILIDLLATSTKDTYDAKTAEHEC